MLDDVRESEGNRREWIVEILKEIDGKHTGFLHKGELVRCKECKYWAKRKFTDGSGEIWEEEVCDHRNITAPTADDFCSYGEREGE